MVSSRLNRISQKRSRRQAVLYLLLSIVFVFAMIRWGIPGFIQLLSWWTGADKPAVISSGLKVPPQAPALAPIPEATFSAQIKVEGIAQKEVKVRLITNGATEDEIDVESDGRFVFDAVNLMPGKNIIGVQAVAGDLESEITQAEVILDTEPPQLDIYEPAEEADFYGPTQRNVQIKGTMKERGEVFVNGNFVVVSSSGEFSYRLSLSPGMNEVTVTAIDLAGNQTTKLLRLRYTE